MPTAINELDLMELPIEDRAFGADPEPGFAQARACHPWLAKFTHGYLVHGHHEIRDLIQMDDKLHIATGDVVEIMGATGKPWGDFMMNLVISKRGEEHRRVRDALKPFFKPRRIAGHVELIRAVVSELLDDWGPKGEFDFTEFASNFPVAVMFGLIGADLADLPKIKWALEVQGLSYSLDPSLLPQMEDAHAMMMEFTSDLVNKRRGSGQEQDDLLQELVWAEDAGILTHQEVCEQLFFLFAAGYDTTKNQLSMTSHLLFQQPELWERCARDREFCTLAIEEGLRHSSPSSPPRIALDDIEYKDVLIPKGTHLMFLLNISGRDPRTFDNPMEYRPGREYAKHHLAFGKGAHICLGLHLARFQMEEGLHLIAQRLKDPKIAGEVTWRRFPGVWGLETLPIRFTPA
ncbi:MAG: cytochrome P450 [Novosphingobium sp.]|nr:cytochrome P450 [Novosphingobium sp.]MCP5403811.1 cytochrome P450 [Novosphingobium sp.]